MYVFIKAHFFVSFLKAIFHTTLMLIYKKIIHISKTTLVLLPILRTILTFNHNISDQSYKTGPYMVPWIYHLICNSSLDLPWESYHEVCDNYTTPARSENSLNNLAWFSLFLHSYPMVFDSLQTTKLFQRE